MRHEESDLVGMTHGNKEPSQKRLPTEPYTTPLLSTLWQNIIDDYTFMLPQITNQYTPTLRYNSDTVLREAARIGDMETVRRNLGQLGFCSLNGRTALMEAAINGHLDIVKACLLESGAILNSEQGYRDEQDSTEYSSSIVDSISGSMNSDHHFHINRVPAPPLMNNGVANEASDEYQLFYTINDHNSNNRPNSSIQAEALILPRTTESRDTDSSIEIYVTNDDGTTEQGDTSAISREDDHNAESASSNSGTADVTVHGFTFNSEFTGSLEDSFAEDTSIDEAGVTFFESSPIELSAVSREEVEKIDNIFWIGRIEDQSSLLLPWESTYNTHLRRNYLPDELLRTGRVYQKTSRPLATQNTALTLAIRNFHKDVILLLLEKEVGFAGVTPLMAGAARGNTAEVTLNMEYLNARDANGFTALSLATLFGNLKCAELLIDEFIDSSKWFAHSDPLVIAAKYGRLDHLSLFFDIASRRSLNLIPRNRSRNAVIEAARSGNLDCLIALTNFREGNADISKIAFLYAAKNGHVGCMKHLINVSPKRFAKYDDLILIAAIKAGKLDMIEFLCKRIKLSVKPRPSPLFLAVLSGNRRIIDLVQGCTLVGSHITPLMVAAALGDADGIRQNAGYIGQQDAHGLSALMYAAIAGPTTDVTIYAELIFRESRMVNSRGLPAIAYAIKSNNLSLIERLLEYEVSLVFATNYTILDVAICHGSSEAIYMIANHIYSRKLPIYVKQRQMNIYHQYTSPLIEAVEAANTDDVKKYIYQANFCMSTWSALQKAVQLRNQDCVKLLLCEMGYRNSMGYTALVCAVIDNNLEAAKLLLAELNCTKFEGKTCLMIAASLGYEELVKLLIPYEAGKTTTSGETALILATMDAQPACIKLLLPYEKRLPDYHGHSALMHSIYRKSIECVRILVEEEKRMISSHKYTALALSMQENFLEAATLLYEQEKDISQITNLMWAAFTNDLEAVNANIEQAKTKSATQCTAMMYAAGANNVEVVKLLIPYEQKLVDDTGHSALMYAIEANAIECVDLLLPYESDLRTFKSEGIIEIAKRTGFPEIINRIKAYSSNNKCIDNPKS